jgi:Fanconi anemia group D2 protein
MKYRRMGIIGVLRIVSTIASTDVNAAVNCSSSQVCFKHNVNLG